MGAWKGLCLGPSAQSRVRRNLLTGNLILGPLCTEQSETGSLNWELNMRQQRDGTAETHTRIFKNPVVWIIEIESIDTTVCPEGSILTP